MNETKTKSKLEIEYETIKTVSDLYNWITKHRFPKSKNSNESTDILFSPTRLCTFLFYVFTKRYTPETELTQHEIFTAHVVITALFDPEELLET